MRAVGVLGALMLLAAGCSQVGAKPAPKAPSNLTPKEAVAAVRQYARGEWKAMTTWSTAGQNRLEIPPESTIDDASWAYNRAARVATEKPPANLNQIPVSVIVPPHAPVFEALTNHVYMVFVAKNGRYMQAYSPGQVAGTPVPKPATLAGGYGRLLTGASLRRLPMSPQAVAARYASDLSESANGVPPADPEFAPGGGTKSFWANLAAQNFTSGHAQVAPYPMYAFALKGGGALVFFTVKLVTTSTAPSGQALTVSRHSGYSAFIRPGSYASLTTTDLMTVAAVLPSPQHPHAPVAIVGLTDGVIAVSGTGAAGLA